MSQIDRGRLKRFWQYLRPFRVRVALLFSTIIITSLITLPTPWIQKIIIDESLPNADRKQLFTMVALLVGLFASLRVIIFLRSYLSIGIKQRVLTSVRMHMYEHLQRMSLTFFGKHPIGNLLSRITNDVQYVQNLLNNELFEVVSGFIRVVVVVFFLFAINVKLTLLSACVLPLMGVVFIVFKRKMYKRNLETQQTQEKLSGRIQQNFSGMKLIQAEVIEDEMHRETLEASRNLEQVSIDREVVGVGGNLMTTIISYVPLFTIIWGAGGLMVIDKTLTIGELLAYTQYLFGLIQPLTLFFKFNMDLQAGYAALDRIYELLDTPPDIADSPEAMDLEECIEDIAYEGVSLTFGANDEEPSNLVAALDGVSFSISKGEKIALVGPSGAGKTSILNLLLRFYEPTKGAIRVNGTPIDKLKISSLRQRIAYVSQDVFLFGTDVEHNVTLGKPIGNDRLRDAMKLSCADEFIDSLEGGLRAHVEPGGTNFSGGQRQRLALARALSKSADLFIFDEATAALDNRTEQVVMGGLRDFLAERTAILIAHRFSFLDLVDRILVFSEGRLVEQGSLKELLEQKGLFHTLYTAQQGAPSPAQNRVPS